MVNKDVYIGSQGAMRFRGKAPVAGLETKSPRSWWCFT